MSMMHNPAHPGEVLREWNRVEPATAGRASWRWRFQHGRHGESREQRRVELLIRAAYGVGHTQRRFMAMPRPEQEAQVRAWVGEALESREIRLGRLPPR